MTVVNKISCAITDANTGVGTCTFKPENIVGALHVPVGYSISEADLASVDDVISAIQNSILDTSSARVYPVFRFVSMTDSSEEETVTTEGYGDKEIVKDGAYEWVFKHKKGGMSLHNKLRLKNQKKYDVMFFDKKNVLFGSLNSDGTLGGFSTDYIYEKKLKIADGSNATIFETRYAMPKPEELNENIGVVQLTSDPEELFKGILDVELVQVAVASGVATVKVQTVGDEVNLYDSYSTALAVGSLWLVKKAGVPVSVTSVTADADNEAFDIAFTGTGVHTIELTTPALLAAAHVGEPPANGIEGNAALSVTMP